MELYAGGGQPIGGLITFVSRLEHRQSATYLPLRQEVDGMHGYTQRVCDSILPLSVADTLPEAFREWFFTEQVIDHEQPAETCELCGQEELRYHFEIENRFSHKTLWVGSHCILKFRVAVYEDGELLTNTEAKRKLDKLTEKMRLDSCIKALEKLASSEQNPILRVRPETS
jgi:hypothetical protein